MVIEVGKRIIEKEEVFIGCPHCDREIIGSTEKQVLYNLNVHINQKHCKGEIKN